MIDQGVEQITNSAGAGWREGLVGVDEWWVGYAFFRVGWKIGVGHQKADCLELAFQIVHGPGHKLLHLWSSARGLCHLCYATPREGAAGQSFSGQGVWLVCARDFVSHDTSGWQSEVFWVFNTGVGTSFWDTATRTRWASKFSSL